MSVPYQEYNSEHSRRIQLLRWAGWFFFANLILVLLVSIKYLLYVEIPDENLARFFTALVFIGHLSFVVFIIYLLVLPFIIVLPITPFIMLVANFLATSLVVVMTIDTFLFAQYRMHFNGMVFSMLFGGSASEIFQFSARDWFLAFSGTVMVLAFEILLSKWIWNKCRHHQGKYFGYLTATLLVGAFIGQNMVYAWADAQAYTAITKQVRYLPGYKPLTAKAYFVERGMAEPNPAPVAQQIDDIKNLHYPKYELFCEPPQPPYNLFIIVIDSWRADTLHPKITPNIFEFSKTAWQFNNHYSAANATRTGIFNLFYGIPGTYWHTMLAEHRQAVLITKLVDNQYQMGIFASASLINPEFNHTVFANIKNLRIRSSGKSPHERDKNITESFGDFLSEAKNKKQPVFGFLFYDSPHGYDYPSDYPTPFEPSLRQVNYLDLDENFNPGPFINRYKNSLHFTDSLAGTALNKIAEAGLMDNSIIVITSDHGQEFNDTGQNYWGHNSNFSDYQTRVPLLVKWPGKKHQDYVHITSHYDIAPTLMQDFLGCSNAYSDYSIGKHLLMKDDTPPYLIMSNYNSYAIKGRQHTIVINEFGQVESFDQYYQSVEENVLTPNLVLNVMNDMAQFYTN